MSLEDLRKLATGSLLFSLDRIITPRLVNVLYLLGLATIVLWAVNHLFFSFAFGFGNGLWGLLEIAVFGLMAFVILRIVCETLIVFFKANEKAADAVSHPHPSATLLDDVRDAIEDLAEEEETPRPALPAKSTTSSKTSASKSVKSGVAATPASTKAQSPNEPAKGARRPVRRTAKRSPARRTSK